MADRLQKEEITILIVEDSPTQQKDLQNILESHGYRTRTSMNGNKALDFLNNNRPDIIITDIIMPEMDGYETTRQIRKLKGEKGHIRICAMTANVTKDEIDACLASGMNDYMMKPFTHEILKEKILKNTFVHA